MQPLLVQRTAPFSPQQLFDVAANIEDYPNFLTNCVATRIVKRDGETQLVDNVFRWGPVPVRFRTRAILDRPRTIDIETVPGKNLAFKLSWTFSPNGVETDVELRMALSSDIPLLNGLFEDVLRQELEATEQAFLKRVAELNRMSPHS